jgi:hypothetical protein
VQLSNGSAVILLDVAGAEAPAAARELASVDPERTGVYYVAGGSEAWLAQELPWKEPLKLGINLDTLKAIDISGVAAGATSRRSPLSRARCSVRNLAIGNPVYCM